MTEEGLLAGDVRRGHFINGCFVEVVLLKQLSSFKRDIVYSITHLLVSIECQELAFKYLAFMMRFTSAKDKLRSSVTALCSLFNTHLYFWFSIPKALKASFFSTRPDLNAPFSASTSLVVISHERFLCLCLRLSSSRWFEVGWARFIPVYGSDDNFWGWRITANQIPLHEL